MARWWAVVGRQARTGVGWRVGSVIGSKLNCSRQSLASSETKPRAFLRNSKPPAFELAARCRVPEEPVRVVEMHEIDLRRRRGAFPSEPGHRFGHERVRDCGDRAARDFVGGEKRSVHEGEQGL